MFLHLINKGNSESFIDISICNAYLVSHIADWFVSDAETLLGHKQIITKICLNSNLQHLSKDNYLNRKYMTNVKWNHFELVPRKSFYP